MKKVLLLSLTLITLGLSSAFAQQHGNLEDFLKKHNVPRPNLTKNNSITASERGAILVDSTKSYDFTSLKDSTYTGKKITYRKTEKDYVTFNYLAGVNKPIQKDTIYYEANKNSYFGYFVEGTPGKLNKPSAEYKYYYNAKVNDFDSLIGSDIDSKGVYSVWLKEYWNYDALGKKVQDSVITRDYITGILKPSRMYKYTYNTNGKLATEDYYVYLTNGNKLAAFGTYTYPNALTENISYVSPQGVVGAKSIRTYNSTDFKYENRTSFKYWRFDTTINDLKLEDSTRVKFDANKNPISEEYWSIGNKYVAKHTRKFNNINQILVESYLEKADAEPDFKLSRRIYGYFSAGVSTKENHELEAKTNIYPNPTTNSIFVEAPENATATIFDLNGRILLSQQTVNQWISVSNLPKGMYLMQITNKEGASAVKKIVKE